MSAHSIPASIGPYPIERELGRGGMGVVYLGRDPRLNRPVAIKVLPEEVARDPMRLSRFEREARTLAALNHRNVGLIYGLEESDGRRLLVLEFVPGATLTQRIARGPMPLDETLKSCSQIAEGLEAAHERDVVHRDLKPDNIKITPDGSVKILDFGLATTHSTTSSSGSTWGGSGSGGVPSDDATTLSPPAAHTPTPYSSTLTQHGMVMGTPGYMSPEQARGFPIDKRTDIWAFGCVLFECLSGLRCFSGPTPSDMLVAVIEREPDWSVLPARTPARLRDLLRKCLVKDTRRRLRDIGDARIELEEILSQPASGWYRAAGAAGPERPRALARLTLPLPAASPDSAAPLHLTIGPRSSIAVSPDGAAIAFIAGTHPHSRVYVRRLEQPDARAIPDTTGAQSPFFSPDGTRLGYFADGRLFVVPLAGGAPLPLAAAPRPQGACWSAGASGAAEDSIYFIPDWQRGLFRIASSGGTPEEVAAPDLAAGEIAFLTPEALPSGTGALVSVWTGAGHDHNLIIALDQRGVAPGGRPIRKPLISGGSNPRCTSSGHLVFSRAGSLLAVAFDSDRLTTSGQPVPIEDRILGNALTGVSQFGVGGEPGSGGTLAYAAGGLWEPKRSLVSLDRQPNATPIPLIAETNPGARRAFSAPAISPDGARLIVQIEGGGASPTSAPGSTGGGGGGGGDDLWLIDLARQSSTRLTFQGDNAAPVWSPDGKRIAFRSNMSGRYELYWMTADGAGVPEPLVSDAAGSASPVPDAFTPDGRSILYTRNRAAAATNPGTEIWLAPIDNSAAAAPIVSGLRSAWGASVSPDGRTIAFTSDDSGNEEVYVQPMPASAAPPGAAAVGARRPVTGEGAIPSGGSAPLWLRAGGELVFRAGDSIIAVRIALEPSFMVGRPRTIAQGAFLPPTRAARNFDAFPSGQQLALIRADDAQTGVASLNIVLNWLDELRRRAPLPASSTHGSGHGSGLHTPHASRPGSAGHTPHSPYSPNAPTIARPAAPSPSPYPPRNLPPGFNDSKTIG